MKKFTRNLMCVALAGGFSLLVGMRPALAVQPWDLNTVTGLTSCKTEAQQVILETVYQRSLNTIYKDSHMKGVIGSTLGVAVYLAVYDTNSDPALRNAALVSAQNGVTDLIAKLQAISSKSPQMTTGAAFLILNGRTDSQYLSYTYTNSHLTNVSGTVGPHDGVNGDVIGDGTTTKNLFQCVDALPVISL